MQTQPIARIILGAALCCGLLPLAAVPARAQQPVGPAVGGGLIGQIGRPYIAEELRLTDDQQEQIKALLDEVRDFGRTRIAPPGNGQDPLTDEQKLEFRAQLDRAMAEENVAAANRLHEILDEQQFGRLKQIWLQQIGLDGILQPEISAEIGLSEDQRETLLEMYREEQAGALSRKGSQEEQEAARDEFRQRWMSELTDAQREKVAEVQGPPFTVPQVAAGRQVAPGNETAPPDSSSTPVESPSRLRTRSFPAASATAAPPATNFKPLATEGPVVASLDRDNQTGEVRTGDPVKFNFENAPWTLILDLFAERAGYVLNVKETPPGSWTYHDPKSYTITDALDVLNGYLLQEGYVLIHRDNALVSVRIDPDEGLPPNLIPEVTPAQLVERGRNELVSVIFPLEPGVDVQKLSDEIFEITGPQGNCVALTAASGLYVTDTAGNLRRIYDIIKTVVPPRTPEDLAFRAYALTYIDADEAEYLVSTMLGSARTVANVSAGGGGDDRDRRGFPGWPGFGGDQNRGGSDRDRQRGATTTTIPQATVTAELRTNQLLVSATASQHKVVEDLVKAIDVDTSGQPTRVGSFRPYLQVYKVSGDAREVAKTLTALLPQGIVINEDGHNGTIHVKGTEAQHRQVQEYLRQLEGGGGAQTVTVIPLSTKDPISVASILRTIFVKDGTDAPTIEPNLQERQLIVRGTSDQILQIRTILSNMGEDGTGVRPRSNNMPFVQIPIPGHNADELLNALQQAYSRSNRPQPLIIPRSNSGLIRNIITPENRNGRDRAQSAPPTGSQPEATDAEPTATPRKDAASVRRDRRGLFNVVLQDGEDASDNNVAPADPDAAAPEQDESPDNRDDAPGPSVTGPPPFTIMVQGDQLLILGDSAAVEEAAGLLDQLMAAMPVRTSWTIFTLQSGSADEVANMLKLLLPDVSVSSASPTTSSTSFFGSMSGGLNALGSGLADMTGLSTLGTATSLTIIPDARLNSLFVTGPESRIAEVEQLLEVLDASEWSAGTLRERRPRMIEVKHAEVADVYDYVSAIYANYLETGRNSGGRNQQNPFQMLVGGGRGGGGGAGGQDNEVKLTISADTRTNHLIVSANEALFQEIQAMVEDLDQKALEAKRTVQIVALQHASPNLVKNAVSTLMPKVTVSGTGGGNNGGSNFGGYPGFRGGDNNDNGGGPSGDDVRRMMEFRERMRQSQSGGAQATGGPGFGGGDNGSRFGGRGFGGGDFGGRGFGGGDFGGRGFGGGDFGGRRGR